LQAKIKQANRQRRDHINIALGKKEEEIIAFKQSAQTFNKFKQDYN